MKKSEFISTIAPIVQAENKKRGNPLFSSVVIAQAICESAWGQSAIMMKANAIFGIKATASWKGKVYNANTQECYDGVSMTNINACFRAYDNLQQSISDYFDLICGASRYKKALNCSSAEECITAIKKGGYATDPNYITTIISIINSNNLKKYDVENVDKKANNSNVPHKKSSATITYTVVAGDNLSKIAKKYNTTWQKIYESNKAIIGDDPNIIVAGQKLKIHNNVTITYTVVAGDNLSKIAKKYNTTWQKIYESNKAIIGDNPNIIVAGQELKIYV